MDKQRTFVIKINGIEESISQIDSLIKKIDSLSDKIDNLNKSGISIKTTGGGGTSVQVQQAQQVEEAQKQITIEITKQNEELRQQSAFVDSTKQASNDVLAIANQVLGVYGENIAKLDQLNQALAANKQAQKDVASALKDESIDAATAAESRQRLLEEELRLKQARSEVNTILKNEVKLTQAQEGSYDRMSQTLGRLRDALRASGSGLSPEQFNKVSEAVDRLDKELKEADASVGNFNRNVGNYASAADGFQKITVTIGGVTKEFDSAKSAIMELKNSMAQLVMSGEQGTAAYKELEEQMKNLQLAMVTVNDSIDRAKDASSGLHTAVEALQGLTAIAGIGQGLSSLFGIDNGALGEQIKKLTSLMTIMQGLQQLSTSIATGTGIGPALKKVLDISGINNDWKQFKDGLTVIGQKLGIVKVQAEGAAVGFSAMAAAAKVAEAAVKGIGRALLIGFAIEAVVWSIEKLIDGIKALYNVMHDWVSMDDEIERSNKALADSVGLVSDALDEERQKIENTVRAGGLSQNVEDAALQQMYNEKLSETTELLKENIALKVEAEKIQPRIHNWEKLVDIFRDYNAQKLAGKDVDAELETVTVAMIEHIVYELQKLDTANEEEVRKFWKMVNDVPELSKAFANASNSSVASINAMSEAFSPLEGTINKIIGLMGQLENKMATVTNQQKRMAEYIRKYGKNAQAYMNRDDAIAGLSSGLSAEDRKTLIDDENRKLNDAINRGNKSRVSSAKKTKNDLVNIEKSIQSDKLAAMRDGLTKTIATIETERRRRLEEIDKYAADEATKNRARVQANARYDKEILDAKKKFHDDYIKEEKDFARRIADMDHEIFQQGAQNLLSEIEFKIDEQKLGKEQKAVEDSLQNHFREILENAKGAEEIKKLADFINIKDIAGPIIQKYDKNKQKLDDLWSELDKIAAVKKELELEGKDLPSDQLEELGKKMKEYYDEKRKFEEETKNDLNKFMEFGLLLSGMDDLKAKIGELDAEVEKAFHTNDTGIIQAILFGKYDKDPDSLLNQYEKKVMDLAKLPTNADNPMENLRIWKRYYADINQLELSRLQMRQKTEKDAINETREYELNKMKEQRDAELESLKEVWKKRVYDGEWLKENKMTMEQARGKYLLERATLEETWNDRIKEKDIKFQNDLIEIDRKASEEKKTINADYWRSVLNRYNEAYSIINKVYGTLEEKNTDEFGILDLGQFKKDSIVIQRDFETLTDFLLKDRENLRQQFSKEDITFGDFSPIYSEMNNVAKESEISAKKVEDNYSHVAPGTKWKGVDEWIQQVAQAWNQVMSAMFEYQNGEFDRMQDEIDKQLELVEKKYDEMEELAQEHKDKMNEIEDELSTARGDRRQHLIDALSSEIQAQREALAEQKKYEKQKEALDKRSDDIEKDRKKAQKQQALTQAIINAALAISQAAANNWPVPAIPLMALAAAAGAAQVAIISKTHYAKGGLLEGPSHARGGIPLLGGAAEAEGGEFIINKKTTSKNLPLIDFINQKKRKLDISDFVEFYSNGQHSRKPYINNKFADGGYLNPSLELAERLVDRTIAVVDDRPVVVSVVDINNAQARVRNVQAMAGL